MRVSVAFLWERRCTTSDDESCAFSGVGANASAVYLFGTPLESHDDVPSLFAIDATNGRELWRSPLPESDGMSTQFVSVGRFIVAMDTRTASVRAFDAQRGTPVWARVGASNDLANVNGRHLAAWDGSLVYDEPGAGLRVVSVDDGRDSRLIQRTSTHNASFASSERSVRSTALARRR